MALPRQNLPFFTSSLPSTGKHVSYRQMTAREEKILLVAKESKGPSDVLRAVLQVVQNCVPDVDVRDLTIFDLEWLFIQIRIVSVSPESEVSYVDNDDQQQYDFTVDLRKVMVKWPEPRPDNRISVSDDIVMELKWPPAMLYADQALIEASSADAFERLLASCVDKIYDADQVYDPSGESTEELIEWIQDLTLDAYEKAQQFLSQVPHLYYEIEYRNSKGDERRILLTSLSDFFTFA